MGGALHCFTFPDEMDARPPIMTSLYYLILAVSLNAGGNQAAVIGAYSSERECLHASSTRTSKTYCVKESEAKAFIEKIAAETTE